MKKLDAHATEMFDVVDENDNVIGCASRKEVHAKSLIHRSAHILVFNSKGELFLQKRALTKDENPGLWDTSAAGHVNTGEDYLAGAQRELQEELSITAVLVPFLKFKACAETFWEHVAIYTCISDDDIVCDPSEISEGMFCCLEEIKGSIKSEPEKFTSTFGIIFDKYIEKAARERKEI